MKQVFYDPRQLRRKVFRRLTDVSIVVLTVVLAVFAFSVFTRQNLPELLLPTQKKNMKALKERQPELAKKAAARPSRRKTQLHPSDVVLNQGEGLRAAFYENDEASYCDAEDAHSPDRHAVSGLAARDLGRWEPGGGDAAVSGAFLQRGGRERACMASIPRIA